MDLHQAEKETGSWWRSQTFWIAVTALATVAIAATGLIWRSSGDDESRPTNPAPGSTQSPQPSTTTASIPPGSLVPADGILIGVDLKPESMQSCRAPNIASGSAWQVGPVNISGQRYEPSYYCNLVPGGTGSLDFVLGNLYRELQMTIAFADDSLSTSHVVQFELIGDDQYLVQPFSVRFGEVHPIAVDVSSIARLQIKITDQNRAGGGGPDSVPALGRPTLVRAS